MRKLYFILTIIFLASSMSVFAQNQMNYWTIEEADAKVAVEELLNDTTIHNAMRYYHSTDTLFLIKNEEQAIEYAELILFDLYGKETIESERPYGITRYNTYWILCGSMPEGMKGGVFEIIFNAVDCEVLLISHGQ